MSSSYEAGLNPQKFRLLLIVLLGIFVVVISLFWQPDWLSSPIGIVGTAIPLALFVLFGVEYVVFVVRVRTNPVRSASESGQKALIEEPNAEELNTLVSEAGSHGISNSVAWVYLRAILAPRGFYERISERIELGHVSQIRRTSFTCDVLAFREAQEDNRKDVVIMRQISFPPARSALVVPLSLEKRGHLGGGLRVHDESGKPVSTISSYDLAIFQLAVFRHLVRTSPTLALGTYIKNVEPVISTALRRRVSPTRTEREEAMSTLRSFVRGSSQEALMMPLLSVLVEFNPICVSLSPSKVQQMVWPETVRFTVERRKSADLNDPSAAADEDGDSALKWLDGLRILLGVPINRIYAPIVDGDRTRSFHLEVCGPPGTYVARQAFIVTPRAAANELEIDAYVAPRTGQRRARAMVTAIRRQGAARSAKIVFAVKFFERAPGSFAVSTIAAFILTFVTAVLYFSTLAAVSIPQSIAGILLSLPAASVALSGLDSRREFRQPSLLSLGLNALLLLTVALSLFVLLVPQANEVELLLWRSALISSSTALVISISTWIARVAAERVVRAGVDESSEHSDSSATMRVGKDLP